MKQLILILLFPFTCFGQINNLKPEFRNLSWIMDQKASEVIFTLSHYYGNDYLQKTDKKYVTQEKYNLYYDSLTLWKLTNDAYKEKDSKAKSTIIGGYTDSKTKHTNSEWLQIFDRTTRNAYAANGNSTIGKNSCIPSSYANLQFFYAKEAKYIKSHNNGRIKVYTYFSTQDYDNKEFNIHIHDTIKFYLAFHKTIQPIDENAVCEDGSWLPYTYVYAKPKQVVYPAPVSKIWELKTGLPYSVAIELGLTDKRIPILLNMKSSVNDQVLIQVDREYNISVKCDTCNVNLYDSQAEDNDVIDFIYKDSKQQVTIKNIGVVYKITLADDDKFYISAISEGNLSTCTIDATIDEQHHVFEMKQGEKILIKLNKTL